MRGKSWFGISIFFLYLAPLPSQSVQKKFGDSNFCATYLKHATWLPDAYISNAMCACDYLPADSFAMAIRKYLLYSLDTINATFIQTATQKKADYISGKISKRKYRKFVKNSIVPRIYSDHCNAYRSAGCPDGPSPYWEWKVACKRRFKDCNRMLKYSMQFGGCCDKKNGYWLR